jgi:hypothetical protein
MILFLTAIAAVTATPPSEVQHVTLRCLSFDELSVKIAVMNDKNQPTVVEVHNQSFTHELRVPCKDQTLIFYQSQPPSENSPTKEPTWVPLVSAIIPPEGGRFIAILQRTGEQMKLSLVADPEDAEAGGSMRFFNLCQQQVGLSFPGTKQVLDSGKEIIIRPKIAHEEYGQGQFFCLDDGNWRLAGGTRWLQLNDIRTIWFILPTPGQAKTVVLRGIEEKIVSPTDAKSESAPSTTTEAKSPSQSVRSNGSVSNLKVNSTHTKRPAAS